MYYGAVQKLVQAVLAYIRRHQLLKAGDRVGVAVSGGADSVALLRLLLELRRELGIVLSAVHFNHKLRGAESDADEKFVADLAREHKLELHCESADVAGHAAQKHLSLEAAARDMRYAYFSRLLQEGRLNRIATAHTLDDQAETVLLRVVRGAGTRGLAGVYPQISVPGSQFSVIRPLLGTRRKDLEIYLAGLGQAWREDSSNRDLRHARNRVRHGILPRLERNLNPAVREALAETAEIARAEEEYWTKEVANALQQVASRRGHGRQGSGATVDIAALKQLPLALQRRVVRAVAEPLGLRLEFRQVEEILGNQASAKSVVLPHGWVVRRNRTQLQFQQATNASETGYEYQLPVPGRVEVPEAAAWFEAALVLTTSEREYDPAYLLDPALLAGELRVRNWRAGDRFWPAHTKSARKIKELLQEQHVSGQDRKLWPVVVSGQDVVWVRGFSAPARLRPRDGTEQGLLIREMPLRTEHDTRRSSPAAQDGSEG
jgi:tRNA(Ile)-lysidine synthase